MFHLIHPQPRGLILVGVCIVLVAQAHSVVKQRVPPRVTNEVTNNDVKERQLQVFEFGVRAEQLKEELRNIKKTALDEMQHRKAEILNETRLSSEEATQSCQDIKSEILAELRQEDERRRQEMVEFGMKVGQFKDELRIMKETVLDDIQDRKTEVLSEIRQNIEEATRSLLDIVSAALSEKQKMKPKQQDTGNKTYRKYSGPISQPEALEACEKLGARLALPMNKEENDLIWREIGEDDSRQFYWIRGNDKREEGNWVDSLTGEPLPYTNFAANEPNGGCYENCLNMCSYSDTWVDRRCHFRSDIIGYVCEFVN